ncbi:hypothetical protein C8R43DRAFT_1189856 [Mycena crocata]|nr:hypothetical protein C8R43DRAFT_1189856 [Mycena crocata]
MPGLVPRPAALGVGSANLGCEVNSWVGRFSARFAGSKCVTIYFKLASAQGTQPARDSGPVPKSISIAGTTHLFFIPTTTHFSPHFSLLIVWSIFQHARRWRRLCLSLAPLVSCFAAFVAPTPLDMPPLPTFSSTPTQPHTFQYRPHDAPGPRHRRSSTAAAHNDLDHPLHSNYGRLYQIAGFGVSRSFLRQLYPLTFTSFRPPTQLSPRHRRSSTAAAHNDLDHPLHHNYGRLYQISGFVSLTSYSHAVQVWRMALNEARDYGGLQTRSQLCRDSIQSLLWLSSDRRLFNLGPAELCFLGERFCWKDGILGSIQAQVEAMTIRGAVVIDP